MIKKLDSKMDCVEITVLGKHTECLGFDSAKEIGKKLNDLVDAVNAIQKEREAERFEIQEWIGILEAVRQSVNVHEKQIDELQMKLEPEKCKTHAENVPELIRTRKALEIAVDALKTVRRYTAINQFAPKSREAHIVAKKAVAEITALEQKD